jgi:hypothetical protein
MINLLPPELKTSYSYARRNVSLRKWVVVILIALIGLGVLGTFGLLALQQSSLDTDKAIVKSEQSLKQQNYEATQKQVKDITTSFKLVVKVLGQEVLFSQLLKQIATTIPLGSNLTGLTISQTQGAIDITANAIDYRTATQVQVNLADPNNKIFSKADIISITCNTKTDASTSGTAALYPCNVNIRALFAKDNPYLFINSKAAKP